MPDLVTVGLFPATNSLTILPVKMASAILSPTTILLPPITTSKSHPTTSQPRGYRHRQSRHKKILRISIRQAPERDRSLAA
jgi:hypothetical protein